MTFFLSFRLRKKTIQTRRKIKKRTMRKERMKRYGKKKGTR